MIIRTTTVAAKVAPKALTEHDCETVAEILKWLQRNGLSKAELARRTGLVPLTITRICNRETDAREHSRDLIHATFADHLEVLFPNMGPQWSESVRSAFVPLRAAVIAKNNIAIRDLFDSRIEYLLRKLPRGSNHRSGENLDGKARADRADFDLAGWHAYGMQLYAALAHHVYLGSDATEQFRRREAARRAIAHGLAARRLLSNCAAGTTTLAYVINNLQSIAWRGATIWRSFRRSRIKEFFRGALLKDAWRVHEIVPDRHPTKSASAANLITLASITENLDEAIRAYDELVRIDSGFKHDIRNYKPLGMLTSLGADDDAAWAIAALEGSGKLKGEIRARQFSASRALHTAGLALTAIALVVSLLSSGIFRDTVVQTIRVADIRPIVLNDVWAPPPSPPPSDVDGTQLARDIRPIVRNEHWQPVASPPSSADDITRFGGGIREVA